MKLSREHWIALGIVFGILGCALTVVIVKGYVPCESCIEAILKARGILP